MTWPKFPDTQTISHKFCLPQYPFAVSPPGERHGDIERLCAKLNSGAMTERRDLPSYLKPPVIEVIFCGVQFEPIKEFSSVHFGKFLARTAPEYPSTQDREPLSDVLEGQRGPEVSDQLLALSLSLPPLRRVFYLDRTGNYLLQVQASRFLANWRKQREEDEYPHFEATYARFLNGWQQFRDFLIDERCPRLARINMS